MAPVAAEDRADPRLVEDAGRRIEQVRALDQPAVERHQTVVRIERAAAFILPGAGHRRQTADRENLHRAAARARETLAQADIAAPRLPVEPREPDDPRFREPGDPGCP